MPPTPPQRSPFSVRHQASNSLADWWMQQVNAAFASTIGIPPDMMKGHASSATSSQSRRFTAKDIVDMDQDDFERLMKEGKLPGWLGGESPEQEAEMRRKDIERQTVKFNPAKLTEFAQANNVSVDAIIGTLAKAVLRGNPPDHIKALVASQYDDHIAHVADDSGDVLDIYLTENRALSRNQHLLAYTLGLASFVTGAADNNKLYNTRGGNLYLCVGYEYFDYDDVENTAQRHGLQLHICDHNLEDGKMPRVTAARIWWDEASGTYAMATPYDEAFIRWFKLVDKRYKSWNHEEKLWYLAPQILDEVRDKVKDFFGDVHFTGQQAARVVSNLPTDTFAKFAKLVGVDALNKAYRDAAVKFHTDLGGDYDKMAELNQLWSAIKEALGNGKVSK